MLQHLFNNYLKISIMLMLFTVTTFASTIYVNNKTGSDDFTGSSPVFVSYSTGPKLTITSAASRAVNGDIISIAASNDTYQEFSSAGKMLTFTTSDGSVKITTMTIDAQTTLNGPFIIDSAGTLTLIAAVINASNITIQNGCTIIRNNGSFDVTPIFTGSYRLMYTGSTSMSTTSNEWPSTAQITNLTVAMNSGATLKLHTNRSVNSLTLDCGTGGGGFDLSNDGTAYTLTVTGLTTLTSGSLMTTTTGGALIVQGDVNATGGVFSGTVQMAFTGSVNQTIALPPAGTTISNITINKSSGSNKVTITGGDLTCSGVVTLSNGLIVTDTSNALVLTNGGGVNTVKGYTRSLVAGGRSHVVGNVKQNLQYSNLIAYARNEFPVGDTVNYRPVALTFLGSSRGRFSVFATVSHTNKRPNGWAGLPIAQGIDANTALSKYPDFFWSIKTDEPMDNTMFNLDLTAAGTDPNQISLTDVGLNRIKIICRSGNANDVTNKWTLLGNSASYDNVVSNNIPTATAINATGGLSTTGAIVTYGAKSKLVVLNQIPNLATGGGGTTIMVSMSSPSVFGGNEGPLTYTAVSSETQVATVAVNKDIIIVNNLGLGSAVITITATDVDGSSITTTLNITNLACGGNYISGSVSYANTTAYPVSAATIALTPETGPSFLATSSTSGRFIMIKSAGTYTLTTSKTGNWGGVTGADALLVTRHAAGIASLTGLPLQAADVNNSGSVTGADALLIVRRAAGLDTSFAAGDWVFTNQHVTVSSTDTAVNIPGLCVGDVNASYTPSSGSALTKNNILIPIQFGFPKEEPVTVEIYNALGEKKRTLIQNLMMSAGCNQIFWDGKDDAGVSITRGVYHYRINAGNIQMTKQVLVVE